MGVISPQIVKLVILSAIILQVVSQEGTTVTQSVVEAICNYSLTLDSLYKCELSGADLYIRDQALKIDGNHLPGYNDSSVQVVTTRNIRIMYYNGEINKKFVNVKHLNMTRVSLNEISENAFEKCEQLEVLDVSRNHFKEFPNEMLKNCKSLKVFRASNNDVILREIPENFFGTTQNLEIFEVEWSLLRFIRDNALGNMAKLRVLKVGQNQLEQMSPVILSNEAVLEELDISRNNFYGFSTVMEFLMAHLKLKKLSVKNNFFGPLDLSFFNRYEFLEELAVGSPTSDVKITKKISMKSLKTLEVLGIDDMIPENAFDELKNLTSLYLHGNGIRNLEKDTLKELKELRDLTITQANLSFLHPELFRNQIKLDNINLNENSIFDLPDGIFSSLSNLGTGDGANGLHLRSNRISRLNKRSFGQHPHLRYLNFNWNIINAIERGFFDLFHKNITFAGFLLNSCVEKEFENTTNLGNSDAFEGCYENWDESETTTISSTTSYGNVVFSKRFEIFLINFIGILVVLKNCFN